MKDGAQFLVVALALLLAGRTAAADDTWAGAGGAPVPVENKTPIVLELVAVSFTAVPPPARKPEDPRFAKWWEVAVRIDMRNPTDRAVRLTLAVPEVPAGPGAPGPHVPEVVISQDRLRMPIVPRRVEKMPDIGVPCEAFRTVVVEFAQEQRRRVDVLLRQPAPVGEHGTVIARWLGAGLGRFAGKTVPVQRFSWHFGDRVRLVRGAGASSLDTPGATRRFFDDGLRTRLEVEIRDAVPWTTFDIEARAAVPGMAPTRVALPGQPRPPAAMNRAELGIHRALLLALHGRALGRAPEARLFEELPWDACNPAFRLARGEPLPDRPIEALIAEAACPGDCREIRVAPADPFGDPWAEPLCWHSPDRNLERTAIRDPARAALLRDIEQRLKSMDAAPAKAAGKAAPPADRPGGCGCTGVGGRFRAGWLGTLLGMVEQ
ncbi:MAG TPA: hypothetical protein VM285_11855 [Polyangia bacterium]|nr:hypothetical protein [Polyangia bacterium]